MPFLEAGGNTIDTINFGWSIVHIKELKVRNFLKLDVHVIQSLNIVFIFTNSVDPDETLRFVAFHLFVLQ